MSQEPLGVRVSLVYDLQTQWLEPRFEALGLTFANFQLLAAIQGAGKSASQVEIARSLGVSPATLSESVYAQVQAGLIQQVASSTDRRVRLLTLTSKGKALLRKALGEVDRCEEILHAGLADADISAANRVLDQAAVNLEKALDPES